jgi:trans-aconitate methyltransferase
VTIDSCPNCGHLTVTHPPVKETGSDYHLAYDQTKFLGALEATRRRQAKDIVAVLARHGADSAILDYGCGRGFLLEACRAAGVRDLAGVDTSDAFPPALVSSAASLMIGCGRTIGCLDSRIVLAVRH